MSTLFTNKEIHDLEEYWSKFKIYSKKHLIAKNEETEEMIFFVDKQEFDLYIKGTIFKQMKRTPEFYPKEVINSTMNRIFKLSDVVGFDGGVNGKKTTIFFRSRECIKTDVCPGVSTMMSLQLSRVKAIKTLLKNNYQISFTKKEVISDNPQVLLKLNNKGLERVGYDLMFNTTMFFLTNIYEDEQNKTVVCLSVHWEN